MNLFHNKNNLLSVRLRITYIQLKQWNVPLTRSLYCNAVIGQVKVVHNQMCIFHTGYVSLVKMFQKCYWVLWILFLVLWLSPERDRMQWVIEFRLKVLEHVWYSLITTPLWKCYPTSCVDHSRISFTRMTSQDTCWTVVTSFEYWYTYIEWVL